MLSLIVKLRYVRAEELQLGRVVLVAGSVASSDHSSKISVVQILRVVLRTHKIASQIQLDEFL